MSRGFRLSLCFRSASVFVWFLFSQNLIALEAGKEDQLHSRSDWRLIYHQDFELIHFPETVNWISETREERATHRLYPVPYPASCKKEVDAIDHSLSQHPICTPVSLSDDQIPHAYRFSLLLPSRHSETFNVKDALFGFRLESYTRSPDRLYSEFITTVPDPHDATNKVLRLRSRDHTDATLLRSEHALVGDVMLRYRIGFMQFDVARANAGDKGQTLQAYEGDESAAPWFDHAAINENGFYWGAIADTQPRPQSNLWWHHHRKFVIDSDNHYPAWMEIWNGHTFERSGDHPVMIFALDGRTPADLATGKPFISYAADTWQSSGKIRAVDQYRFNTWYTVSLIREQRRITFRIEGDFANAGLTHYQASVDLSAVCAWHFPRDADEARYAKGCESASETSWNDWPKDGVWPDYFFLGDPHINYYEGQLLIDDLHVFVRDDRP